MMTYLQYLLYDLLPVAGNGWDGKLIVRSVLYLYLEWFYCCNNCKCSAIGGEVVRWSIPVGGKEKKKEF